ncbi:protease-4 [Bradyrhizobium diazoefficiens]
MSLDSDIIVDRRRIRRKLTFWRVMAALIAIAAIAGFALIATPGARGTFAAAGSIARVQIDGLIRSDSDRTQALERLENSQAAAVIVHINSPGGTTAGSEQLYDSLVRLKAKKPLVVVVEGLAASGGYITAIASDHIIAQQSSLVGSIGVLFQYPNVTELLKTIGVKVEEVKSSPLKAAPNGFEPTSPEARAALDELVKDSYAWFKGLVKERRGMDDTQLEKVADGRVFTGTPGDRSQADRPDRRREDGGDLAGRAEGRQEGAFGARLQASVALRRSAVPQDGRCRDAGSAGFRLDCASNRANRRRAGR